MEKIKNLASLKRAINAKRKFEIIKHYVHPYCTGQIRVPNVIGKTYFYSIVDDDPENKVSLANDGKGYHLAYKKASNWKFDEEKITYLQDSGKPIMTIRFVS